MGDAWVEAFELTSNRSKKISARKNLLGKAGFVRGLLTGEQLGPSSRFITESLFVHWYSRETNVYDEQECAHSLDLVRTKEITILIPGKGFHRSNHTIESKEIP